ncbi:hypothetical protein PUN28_003252 [Cardiocondyla obscurior]|uniref:Uncharacterized protein n=1 Tax=Cardiocondyla obscurior TaxID=286306 RepID=A0AAW2GLX7_9HYME
MTPTSDVIEFVRMNAADVRWTESASMSNVIKIIPLSTRSDELQRSFHFWTLLAVPVLAYPTSRNSCFILRPDLIAVHTTS